MGYRYNEDEKKILNRAERISSKGKTYIMGLLSRGWSNRSMALWKSLREIVLKYPTANEEEYQNNELIKNLYICGYKDLKKYLYAQKGDFSDTIIEFFHIRIFDFTNQSFSKCWSDKVIIHIEIIHFC